MPDSASEGSVGRILIGKSQTVCSVFSWKGPFFSFQMNSTHDRLYNKESMKTQFLP